MIESPGGAASHDGVCHGAMLCGKRPVFMQVFGKTGIKHVPRTLFVKSSVRSN